MPTPLSLTSRAPTRSGGPRRATLQRSLRLLNEFRHEQDDPARFYEIVAHDAVDQLQRYTPLERRGARRGGGARLLP